MNKLLLAGLLLVATCVNAKNNPHNDINLINIGNNAVADWDVKNPNKDVLLASAIELSAEQCPDGGFGYSHNDCNKSYYNIVPAIVAGIRAVNHHFNNDGFIGIMVNAGDFLLTDEEQSSPMFSTFAAYMLFNLSRDTGDTVYRNWADSEFFQALQNGTYGPNDYDVEGYINYVRVQRPAVRKNALAWDFSSLVKTSQQYCYPVMAGHFEGALLNAISQLNNLNDGSNGSFPNVYYDTEGLAGGILGLAQAKISNFPPLSAPHYSAIDGTENLTELIDVLLQQQNPDGSFYWHSNLNEPGEGSKDGQTTAIAVQALTAASTFLQTEDYLMEIEAAQKWLLTLQQPHGGFVSQPGSTTQVSSTEGKILQALAKVPITDRIYKAGMECYVE